MRTPLDVPLLIDTVEYHSVGERVMTRAVTGAIWSVPSSSSRPTSLRSSAASRAAASLEIASLREASSSLRSSSRSFLASSVSPNQPNRSRTGFRARLAPSWIGETTWRNPRCTLCSGLLWDSPKYAVRSIREQTTSSTSTARRRRTDLSYTAKASPRRRNHTPSAAPDSVAPAAVAGILVGAMDDFELLQRPAGAHRDTRQRRLGQMAWHLGLLAKAIVQPLQQRTAPGEHDAAIHDVGCELGRGS